MRQHPVRAAAQLLRSQQAAARREKGSVVHFGRLGQTMRRGAQAWRPCFSFDVATLLQVISGTSGSRSGAVSAPGRKAGKLPNKGCEEPTCSGLQKPHKRNPPTTPDTPNCRDRCEKDTCSLELKVELPTQLQTRRPPPHCGPHDGSYALLTAHAAKSKTPLQLSSYITYIYI